MRDYYAWPILLVAAVFEMGFAIGLKYSDGFTRLWPSLATVIMIVLSLSLLGVATRSLPMGTVHAFWTGIGSVGTVTLGIVLFGESAALNRLACLALIIMGIIGLNSWQIAKGFSMQIESLTLIEVLIKQTMKLPQINCQKSGQDL
jgi:quaternary ammonium compound-resistance protein SugE